MWPASSMLWVAIRAATPVVLGQVVQGLEHRLAGGGIEVAGRLVGQQQARLVGQGAGDGDALLLPARHLGRLVRQAFAEAQRGQEFLGAGAGARLRTGRRCASAGRRCRGRRTPAAGGGTGRRSRSRLRRIRVRARSSSSPTSSPSMQTWPEVGRSSRPAACSRDDLPEPDGPISPTSSPGIDVQIDAPQHGQLAVAGDVGAGQAAQRKGPGSLIAKGLHRIDPRRVPGRRSGWPRRT